MRWRSIGALCLLATCACGRAHEPPATAPCDVANWHITLPAVEVRPYDVLFVIDNSPGMESVQAHLRDQLPRLFDVMHAGEEPRPLDTFRTFPAEDLHLGVITGDLGLSSAPPETGCTALGDAARFRQDPSCDDRDPEFIRYYQALDDDKQTRDALACLGAVGTTGCAVQQPLAAAVQMVIGPGLTQSASDPIMRNAFLARPGDPLTPWLIIVVITNQDDCSLADPSSPLSPDDARALSQHCGATQLLGSVQSYVDTLSPEHTFPPFPTDLVVIAGVPEALSTPNESLADAAFYQQVLDDPRMQLKTAPDGSLLPSCSSSHGSATPPRRLIEAVRNWPQYSATALGSICADDLTTSLAFRLLNDAPDTRIICAPIEFVRDSHGLVPCRITWELPKDPLPWSPLAPTACSERPGLLSDPNPGEPRIGPHGGALCDEHQVAMGDDGQPLSETDQGFRYINDYGNCVGYGTAFRDMIAFTDAAEPPAGVYTTVDCLDDVQRGPSDGGVPSIGTACDHAPYDSLDAGLHGDALCASPDGTSSGLFCHPVKRTCVRSCTSDADCPPLWYCDPGTSELAQSAGRAICVNPGCSQ